MVVCLAVHSVQDVEGLEAKQRATSPLPFLDHRIRFVLFRELFVVFFFPVCPVFFPVFPLIFRVCRRRHLGGGGRGRGGGRREREGEETEELLRISFRRPRAEGGRPASRESVCYKKGACLALGRSRPTTSGNRNRLGMDSF